MPPAARTLCIIPGWFKISAEPSITMPLPKVSCAWAMVFGASPGTTRCGAKPKARSSQAMAAGAS